jgi:DNA-binding NtrC family response regulator
VLEAESGLSAIEQFDKGVDLVLLDSGLPDVDGIEVLRHLTNRNPDARVILMTADAGIETAVESVKLGSISRVHKPFLLDEIVGLVRRTCTEVTPPARENFAPRKPLLTPDCHERTCSRHVAGGNVVAESRACGGGSVPDGSRL